MWTVLQNANKVVQYQTDGTILGCYPDGQKTPLFASPYTYSDFTGSSLELTAREMGRTQVRLMSAEPLVWQMVALHAITPPSTSLCVRARAAASAAALAGATWTRSWCEGAKAMELVAFPLRGADGKASAPEGVLLDVEIELGSSDPALSPLVTRVSAAGLRR